MSLNDPQWGNRGGDNDGGNNDRPRGNNGGGRRPNQGPPDLDELWSDLNERLSGMLGGGRKPRRGSGNNGGGGGGGQPPIEFNPKLLSGGVFLLAALALIAWLASGIYIVDAAERALVLQFGRYKETTGPGLQWRFPYPIQSHERINVSEMRSIEVGYKQGNEQNRGPRELKEALMLTDDLNIIDVQFAVQYTREDPKNYLFKNRDPEQSVKQAAETAIREVVGKSRMDFVLNEGREQIAASVAELMQGILDRYETGIRVSKVAMRPAQAPEPVKAAFEDVVKAGQDRERQINEGQSYANEVIPRARGTAARLLQEAEGYRQRMIATAEGDANRFRQLYAEYAKAPEVTRNRLYLETMQEIFGNTAKVMVDTKGQGNLLYLPLDKLTQAAGAALPSFSGAARPGEPPPQSLAQPDPRARGGLQRERGER